MNEQLSQIDDIIYANLVEIKRRIGPTNYEKIESLLSGMLREAEYCGEKIYQARIDANRTIEEKIAIDKALKEADKDKKKKQIVLAHKLRQKGLTYKEISEEMGVSIDFARNLVIHYHAPSESKGDKNASKD